MHNKLIEIPENEWPELRDMYVERKVDSSGFYLLKTLCEWVQKCPEIGIKIHSLNGQWREDGTFIAIIELFSNVFCNTLSDDLSSLKAALCALDTKPFYRFFGFSERLMPAIKEFFSLCGLTDDDFKPDGTAWYYIPKEKAAKFAIEPPEGYTIGPVDPSFNTKINSIWPHRGEGSEYFVKILLTHNDSVGLFDKEGNLVAWCLRLPTGSLGLLQVDEPFKRKGFGSLMVRCMAKKLLEKDERIMAPVVFTNTASRTMFENLGFEVIDNVYWVTKAA